MGANVERCLRHIMLKNKMKLQKEWLVFLSNMFKIYIFNYKNSTFSWEKFKKHTSWMRGKFLLSYNFGFLEFVS